jgi:hypothetical protein
MATRAELEEAYAEATRTAGRSAIMGALGFGLGLVMFAVIAGGKSPIGEGFWLEKLLLAGGLAGGVMFTVLGLRASRAADRVRKLLEGAPRSRDGAA